MLEPSRLPVELFAMVIDYATDGENDPASLCTFSLVSRQWYAYLSAKIYSRWFCLVLSAADLNLIRSSIHTTGLQHIETSILEAARKADPRPLMALLLMNLRNLTTLYAHLPETDIFFAEVLRKAVESRRDRPLKNFPPLHKLREAHLASCWNYRKDFRAEDHYKLGLNHLWPVFNLPNIQRLSVFDFESLGASGHFRDSLRTSSITDLTLVHRDILSVPDTMALLTLSKRLTKLSFYLNDCDLAQNSNQITNAELWNCIGQYEDCIEHLDIYRDCTGCDPPVHRANNSHFGRMQGFKRLETLCIQPEVLLGGCCDEDLAPYGLRDTLPPNLKSLTFYGDEGLSLNKNLAPQLKDVIMSTDFPRLAYIALEMTSEYIRHYIDPANPPHDAVEQACRERAIKYETRQASSCTKGGIGSQYYRYVAQKRLQMLKKLDEVRYALTAYLHRLGESTFKDEASTGDRPKLSFDDLDTYELPWDELTSAVLYPEAESESEWHSEGPSSEYEDWNTDDTASQVIDSDDRSTEGSIRDVGAIDRDSDISSDHKDWVTDDTASAVIDLEERSTEGSIRHVGETGRNSNGVW
ncbi:hypothetical protein CNMCM8980_001152 [Aspergillus fumigatiaffinis]|nr:hypothetical protein CNMCM8980_001152 [Aspergillus fumigatiaffinis]